MRYFHNPALAGIALFLNSITDALAQNFTTENAPGGPGPQGLPKVDLGYEVHQAISFNQTGQTYNFSNIRYAQPPVGNLRFAPPVAPVGRDPVVQNGSVGRICPQAVPYGWFSLAGAIQTAILTGTLSSFDYTAQNDALQEYLRTHDVTNQTDGRATEDCLFLDVIVPKAIFDKAARPGHGPGKPQNGGAPVVIWFYGGGYVFGSKALRNPSGFIKASQAGGEDGVIWVQFNYRVGALGWLGGPTFQNSGGTPNAGLYDQRLAIEWVSNNIHLFGGDPKRITLLGESAGGGSITHQITAFGGQKPVLFQQAIPQSPGFDPVGTNAAAENITNNFFKVLGVKSLAEARQKSSAEAILANTIQVGYSFPYGSFTYGPMVDGVIVPALPGNLLASGRFAKDVSVMVGHNSFESASFTPPYLNTEADFATWLNQVFPGITNATTSYILNTLYPPSYTGGQPYTSPLGRAFLIVQEFVFVCNTFYLNKGFNNNTYAYEFQVPPGFHALDLAYTFYNGEGTNITAGLIAPVAEQLQGYLTNFAMHGNPNGRGLPNFPKYGPNAMINGIGWNETTQQRDDAANPRCAWWQKGLYA